MPSDDADREIQPLQRRNIDAVAKIEAAIQGERSLGERIGRFCVRYIGTWKSFVAHGALLLCWMGANSGLLGRAAVFDPYPFNLLSLAATLEAILLALLILLSQNRLQHESDRRSHLELQINLMAEIEGTKMLQMLDTLCRHFGLAGESKEVIDELKAETDPEAIVRIIKESIPMRD